MASRRKRKNWRRLEQNPDRQLLMALEAFAKFLFKISFGEKKQSQVSSKKEISAHLVAHAQA